MLALKVFQWRISVVEMLNGCWVEEQTSPMSASKAFIILSSIKTITILLHIEIPSPLSVFHAFYISQLQHGTCDPWNTLVADTGVCTNHNLVVIHCVYLR